MNATSADTATAPVIGEPSAARPSPPASILALVTTAALIAAVGLVSAPFTGEGAGGAVVTLVFAVVHAAIAWGGFKAVNLLRLVYLATAPLLAVLGLLTGLDYRLALAGLVLWGVYFVVLNQGQALRWFGIPVSGVAVVDTRPVDNRAWLLVLPVVVIVSISAIIPLMTVVNYSVQDIFGPNQAYFVGAEWFREMLHDQRLHGAMVRQILFSLTILAIEIPLGVAIALAMPARGWQASLALVLVALPLLIPWNVVGTIWQIFGRPDIGLGGWALNSLGFDYNYTGDPIDAWITVVVMDVWHWTPLVVLLAYAGLRAIPDAFYQAAAIDGASRWATFRYIELPKMLGVLMIAVLLRFMDSFMIYTEPFVLTGGGPGNATTFLSIHLAKIAIGQFDLGPAAAFSIIYFLVILLFSFVFYTVLTRVGRGDA
jgi:glycerol transport system permease protein